MVQATPGVRVMQASATVWSGVPRVKVTTSNLCTWFKNTGRAPICLAKLARFATTSPATSPTWSPRFSLSKGGLETPPARVVQTAPSQGGAGQSGRIQSGFKGVVGAQASGFVVGATRGLRRLERFKFHAGVKRCHGSRQAVQSGLEALCIKDLGHQATIGQRRGASKTISLRA
jgi:hypothetical protein